MTAENGSTFSPLDAFLIESNADRSSVVSLPVNVLSLGDLVPSVVALPGFLESTPEARDFLIGC